MGQSRFASSEFSHIAHSYKKMQQLIESAKSNPSATVASCVLGGALSYGVYRTVRKFLKKDEIVVTHLRVFPVKSCGGFDVQEWLINEYGLAYDRTWMIIREKDNKFVTQREKPQMVFIKTSILLDSNKAAKLTLNYPNTSPITVEYVEHVTVNDNNSSIIRENVTIWGDKVSGLDCGDAVAKWLSNIIGEPVRLVQTINKVTDARTSPATPIKHHVRPGEPEFIQPFSEKPIVDNTGFADGYPMLLSNEASVRDFNNKVIEDQSNLATGIFKKALYNLFGMYTFIDHWNFRSNIIVSSDGIAPYAEEKFREIQINGMTFYGVKRCTRCTMPSVDTKKGVKRSFITDSLNKHRHCDIAGGTVFGMNLCHHPQNIGAKLKVGQLVTLKEVAFVK